WLGPRGAFTAAVLAAAAELHAAAATFGNLAARDAIDLEQTGWALLRLLGASATATTTVAFPTGAARVGSRGGVGLAPAGAAVATLGTLAARDAIDLQQTRWALLGLLGASATAKTIVAFSTGGARFGSRVGFGLALAVAAAAAVMVFALAR